MQHVEKICLLYLEGHVRRLELAPHNKVHPAVEETPEVHSRPISLPHLRATAVVAAVITTIISRAIIVAAVVTTIISRATAVAVGVIVTIAGGRRGSRGFSAGELVSSTALDNADASLLRLWMAVPVVVTDGWR